MNLLQKFPSDSHLKFYVGRLEVEERLGSGYAFRIKAFIGKSIEITSICVTDSRSKAAVLPTDDHSSHCQKRIYSLIKSMEYLGTDFLKFSEIDENSREG